jgi:phosphoenolpyruvate synthase/pyruvate phosphate dikinase
MTKNNHKKGQEWMVWEWPGYNWYQGLAPFRAWCDDFVKYDCQLNQVVATYSKGTEAYYFIKDEYIKAGRKFFDVIKANPQTLLDILKKMEEASEKIFEMGKQIKPTNFSGMTNREILRLHKSLFKWDERLWRQGQIPNLLELSNSYLTDHVKQIILNKFGPEKVNEIFTILTTSNYASMTERQDGNYMLLISKFKSLNTVVKNKLAKHHSMFTWMTYGWSGPALSYDYFLENFRAAAKDKSIAKSLKKNLEHKQAILKKQKLILSQFVEKDRVFPVMLRKLLESKAKRVDAHSLTYFIADKMMLEIGRRVGLSLNQMRMIIPSDVPKLFRTVDVNKINEEYNGVVIWFKRPKATKYIGEAAVKKVTYLKKHLPKIPMTKIIKGELAYPGKVRGTVRVILDIKDAQNFKKNEILVTRMTDPNYITIMKMSKAIITDIGGITCHAAIVSRELRKPCLVGTQFATKIYKDGDMVEVDANKGIVKKIS